ncbi:MAG: hypothetical protein SGARI_002752 [Bacillariaceae sp.]
MFTIKLVLYLMIPGNEDGFGWIQSVTCGEFGDSATFCLCESDCECYQGTECVCEEVDLPAERRFLEAMEDEYKLSLDKSTRDNTVGEEKFNFHQSKSRPHRRLSSKSGKSCKSVKCGKSSKTGEVGVCR